MELNYILFEKKAHVAYITLNRPEKRNPINVDVAPELMYCFDESDYDDDIRMVVIRGAGGNFCGGGDLGAMKYRIDNNIRGTRQACRALGDATLRLRNVKKPTLAYIEGAIAGAGIALAMACDFTIIDEASTATFAFVNIGFIPDCGCSYFLTKAVGYVRATELLMSGKRFNGRQGADWGMFTEAVPADKLEETVQKYIRKYSNGPTVSYANIQSLINRTNFNEFALINQSEVELQGECEMTRDYPEAVNAFLEKRKPEFHGN